MKKVLITYIPFAVAITLLSGLFFVGLQQNFRTSANDPQVQYSQDMARNFKDAKDAQNLVPQEKTNIGESLSTFGIVYNKDGGLLSSSAALDNQTPALPKGVIDYTKAHNQDIFTWQPKKGVRLAAVITKGDAGFVLIGRNMKTVEDRVIKLSYIILAGWLTTLVATFLAIWILNYDFSKKTSKKAPKKV